MAAQPNASGGTPLIMPDVGTRVSLESSRLTGRMWSRIVGWKEQHYLLLETPEAHLPTGISTAFSVDDVLTLRYMHDGMIIGFRTPVLGRISQPHPLTVVAFPHHTETHSLRRHPRMACYLPCRVKLDELEIPRAVIRDVSLNGCRIRIPGEELTTLRDCGTELAADTPVVIHVKLPDDADPQIIAGRVVSFDREAAYAMLRVETNVELRSLVEFVGMFTTRLEVSDIV